MKTLLRAICGVLAGLGVLAIGAWAGGAVSVAQAGPGGPPRARVAQEYPRHDQAGLIRIGDGLVVSGQPMQLSVFYTGDAPASVADFYAANFREKGLVPIAKTQGQLAHVSVFDPEDGFQRFVTALPGPGGQTLVMVGMLDPRHAPQLVSAAQKAPFPVPESHRAYLGYSSTDLGMRADSGQFVTALSGSEVREFYRRELAARGFEERKSESSAGLVEFKKPGGETLTLAVQALDEKKGSAVFVSETGGNGR
jgi:hypothetical protein